MTFDEIFREYYVLYRGQASKIPVFGDREYSTAIILGNAAIKKWERADGILWKELFSTLTANSQTGLVKTITAGTTSYLAPSDMMNPPGQLTVNGSQVRVVPTQDVAQYGDSTNIAWFTGSAQTGFVLHFPLGYTNYSDAQVIDYAYYKKATKLPYLTTPKDIVVDMSDPTFMIQDMLATRAQQARNGFVFKAAKAESTASLANMKIKNDSGTYHNVQNMRDAGSGWGVPRNNFNDIRL